MKYSPEFKLQIGLTEASTDGDVDARLIALQRAETQLQSERALRQKAEADAQAAELDKKRTVASAQIDAWEKDGHLSGNATAAARTFYVALATGEPVTAEQFAGVIAALPKLDSGRVAAGVKILPVASTDVSLDDFVKAGTDVAASRRIAAAVNARKKQNPKFTAVDLERELRAGAARPSH